MSAIKAAVGSRSPGADDDPGQRALREDGIRSELLCRGEHIAGVRPVIPEPENPGTALIARIGRLLSKAAATAVCSARVSKWGASRHGVNEQPAASASAATVGSASTRTWCPRPTNRCASPSAGGTVPPRRSWPTGSGRARRSGLRFLHETMLARLPGRGGHPRELISMSKRQTLVFSDDSYDGQLERTLYKAPALSADLGEAMATARGIGKADADRWYDGWSSRAGEVQRRAEELSGSSRCIAYLPARSARPCCCPAATTPPPRKPTPSPWRRSARASPRSPSRHPVRGRR